MIPGRNTDHPRFLESFKYALQGFWCAITTERNINVQLALGFLALLVAAILKVDYISWCLILICCGLVIFAELSNTAMETIVDLACPEIHPLAKRAKDIAAASVFVLSCIAAIVGIIVFAHALGVVS